jgi:hypothetical protein
MPYVEPWEVVWDDYGHARLVPPEVCGRVSAPANPHPTPPQVGFGSGVWEVER